MAQLQKEKYARARDYPFFDGMRRGEAAVIRKGSGLDILRKTTRNDITRSASDVGNRGQKKIHVELSENDAYYDRNFTNSASESIREPLGWSFSAKSSAASKMSSSPLGGPRSGLKFDLHYIDESTMQSSQRSFEANGEYYFPSGLPLPAYERSYSVTKRNTTISRIPLPQSAALFYCGYSPQLEVVGSCQGIHRLNIFLKARRDDVSAGVPSRFLHAVIGPDCCDVGSVASTIMYAFYLNETLNDNQFCTVPVINMKRSDIHSHAELRWLLDSCFLDQSSLIFIDEIDLSYYDLYGSLKLVLVNQSKLPANQEALKDAVVEIFNCREEDTPYSSVGAITLGKEASCCTLIANKFALTSPEILAGQGFSRLLLAGILVDTGNLTNPQTTTTDKYMTTLLINGAGRFGCNGLYEIFRYKMDDVADLKAGEVLQKDIKRLSKPDAADPRAGEVLQKDIKKLSKSDAAEPRAGEVLQKDNINLSKSDEADPRAGEVLRKDIRRWSKSGKPDGTGSRMGTSNIGMSSVGIPIGELLSHHSTSAENIRSFQQLEKLRILLIVSGYYDAEKNFKREILVSAESTELMKSLLQFIYSYANVLPLKALRQSGLAAEMRVFEIEKIVSRKTIEKLLEEFNEIAK
ncbi:uncharacterized protein [Nicotiana tomentosiformis]|uniref:uncharacterized protein n=1 Tax=Nicotiana tomentosiformis TaxID=4098 RepID=UPI00051B42AE|nr:uncharacterized protein LOC104100291 [Nicotiana tomentosiformis]XP_018627659.1 uncharacterized protein LOC104100291 [Nicotiana tomentosiformis]